MEAQRKALLRDGYVIIRGLIPPALLPELRAAHDELVVTQAKLAGNAPGDLNVGRTVISGELGANISADTAACVEYWWVESPPPHAHPHHTTTAPGAMHMITREVSEEGLLFAWQDSPQLPWR